MSERLIDPIERSSVRGELASLDDFVLHDVVEQHRDSARVDEAARGEGRQRHLAVAALSLEPALDNREHPRPQRTPVRSGKRDLEAQPVIAARVVERDAGQQGSPARSSTCIATSTLSPATGRCERRRAPSAPGPGEEVDAHLTWLVDLYIVRRWRVVVAVAHVRPATSRPTPCRRRPPLSSSSVPSGASRTIEQPVRQQVRLLGRLPSAGTGRTEVPPSGGARNHPDETSRGAVARAVSCAGTTASRPGAQRNRLPTPRELGARSRSGRYASVGWG